MGTPDSNNRLPPKCNAKQPNVNIRLMHNLTIYSNHVKLGAETSKLGANLAPHIGEKDDIQDHDQCPKMHCPSELFTLQTDEVAGKKIAIFSGDPEECVGCESCVDMCPEEAITMTEED